MATTTIEPDTELSAVNSILGSIGQAPLTTLNYNNPETSLEDLLEVCWEVADNCCDISNSSIFQWLADNPGRCEFEEESLSLNPDGINSLWRVARSRQCEEIELMARQLLECLDDGIADGI